jgi:hypothetical protein
MVVGIVNRRSCLWVMVAIRGFGTNQRFKDPDSIEELDAIILIMPE